MIIYLAAVQSCDQYLCYALTLIEAATQLSAPVQRQRNNNIWPLSWAVGSANRNSQQLTELAQLWRIGIDLNPLNHLLDRLLILKGRNTAAKGWGSLLAICANYIFLSVGQWYGELLTMAAKPGQICNAGGA